MVHWIAAIHMSGGGEHKHVAKLVWMNGDNHQSGISTTAAMVEFIEDKKAIVKVSDGKATVDVGVVHPMQGSPYLRTHKDGKWTDNLLALPKC